MHNQSGGGKPFMLHPGVGYPSGAEQLRSTYARGQKHFLVGGWNESPWVGRRQGLRQPTSAASPCCLGCGAVQGQLPFHQSCRYSTGSPTSPPAHCQMPKPWLHMLYFADPCPMPLITSVLSNRPMSIIVNGGQYWNTGTTATVNFSDNYTRLWYLGLREARWQWGILP